MIPKISLEAITALLIILFVYTATSKLVDLDTFSQQMYNQPLPHWLENILVWFLPFAELIIVLLLSIRRLRLFGLLASVLLLLAFTVYVALVYTNTFDRIPCSCGGVFKSMSWGGHLVSNIIFTMLAFIGTYIEKENTKILSRQSLPDQRAQGYAENLK